jgi:hypothetical protein
LVAPTRSSSAATQSGGSRVVLAILLGVVSVATMPVAVLATRYSGSYDLVHSAFAIPIGLVTGYLAVRLSGDRRGAVPLQGRGRSRAAHWLGLAGIWIAGAALVAVSFYGLLTWLGNRS